MTYQLKVLEDSLATFANRAAQKLRKQSSNCATISEFMHNEPFRADLKQYSNRRYIQIPIPTNDFGEIIKWALNGLKQIFIPVICIRRQECLSLKEVLKVLYKKIFAELPEDDKKRVLNSRLDKLNKIMGRNVVKYIVMRNEKWKLRQEMLNPCCTARLDEVFRITI